MRLFSNKENYITTLSRLFDFATEHYAKRTMSCYVDGSEKRSYGEFRQICHNLSHGLSRFGVKAGDRVAILSQNMPNWAVAFFSTVGVGRVCVPILPDSSESEVGNILAHSGTKVLFVSKRLLPKVSQASLDALTLVLDIETLEYIKVDDNAFTCEGWVKEPQADDLATIIYTSGTTGNAKGVMLSHRNLCWNIIEAAHAQPANRRDRWLSILPASHTYEMAFSLLYPIFAGGCVYYLRKAPTPSILMEAMRTVRPTIMCAVPLIIEKVYRNSVKPTVEKSRVLSWLRKHFPRMLYRMVGKRLYKSFGGRLKFFGIGGAKLDPTVEEFLIKAHFPYAIGYGLTETAPLITNACVGKTRVGSCGVAAYGVEVDLADVNPETGEGEIIARGDNVMLGYYRDPERTRKVLDINGWFHTGDLACKDAKGRFYIKGRLGNMIVGPSGENIYPEEIEKVINNISGINESLVLERDGKLVALVKFDDNVLNWNQASEDKFFETLQARKKAILDYVNKHVSKQSKVGDVEVMKEDFEKTATQKIRRFKYKDKPADTPDPEKPDASDAEKTDATNAGAHDSTGTDATGE